MTRWSDRATIGATVTALAVYGVVRRALLPDELHLVGNVAMIGVVAAIAAAGHLSRDELGLSRAALPAGLRVGGIAAVVVGVVVGVAARAAGADSSFVEERIDLSAGEMLFQVLVEIPVATVALEELAFRGVLASAFHRVTSPVRAVVATSALFGLWHVPSAWQTADVGDVAATLGTVVVTAAAGVVFQLMKDRTRSLAAPALAHWATNGLALLVAWIVLAD